MSSISGVPGVDLLHCNRLPGTGRLSTLVPASPGGGGPGHQSCTGKEAPSAEDG